ncbi:glycosyltransferase family 2 protein [Belliella pelovolcani]|uniref:Glycosyltransferase, GT2 family n=1 Tax=Belliella pelovolcani TaxID=529505 RepID=A0A1N7KW40_9BACT|nr:glycosyltransferase family 2 protein [Belliella pelovolcani]SIS65818.1 Glycosyltransferase, GT2 family [Belliella pelovolcani]
MTRISIIICTFNRAPLLELALNSIANQTTAPYEVLVIDNKSTDNTNELVSVFQNTIPYLKYYYEENIGLSQARNRGVRESSGDYLAFIDDDCILPNNWVDLAYHLIENKNPDVFGGPVFPFYEKRKPRWFIDRYLTFEFGSSTRKLYHFETLIGCNFIIRKSVIERIGEFRVDLGMTGTKVLYSEETELQLRYLNSQLSKGIYYDPDLYVHHYARPDKLSLLWNIKAFIGKGKSNYRTKNIQIKKQWFRSFFELAIQLLKVAYFFSIGALFRNRTKYPFYQNYIMERVQGHLKKYGFLLEQFRS